MRKQNSYARWLLIVLYVISLPDCVLAQTRARQDQANTYHRPKFEFGPVKVFPEVHKDHTVTFQISAPSASTVSLSLHELGRTNPMEKDSHGTWSVTIGPLEPNIYAYSFLVDGAKVLDAPNPFGRLGGQSAASLLEIPGDPPRFDETQQVPHGSVVLISYVSTAYKKSRSLYVYLPPGYETEAPRKYPLLYLRHRDGQSEASWLFQGRAGVILENLLAQGKAVPMIIVTTYGESNATGGGTPEGIEALYSELREDVMPLVEQRFRVMSGPENRAIAGLSMGGGQAFTMGMKHLDEFAWIGSFGSGLLGDPDFRLEEYLPTVVADAPSVSRKLRLLFLSCGTEDPRMAGQLKVIAALKKYQIQAAWFSPPGGHTFLVWRPTLKDFLQRLFQH
jgi:enterochelin esterase-like enzyme